MVPAYTQLQWRVPTPTTMACQIYAASLHNEAVCIDDCNTPEWAAETLKRKNISRESAKGRFELGTGSATGCALDLKSSQRNEYSWTALISRHSKCGQGRQALKLYEEMKKDRVEPSPQTFVSLLRACSSLQDLEGAKRIHTEVIRSGFETDLYVGTMLVDVYAKCRSLVDARRAFERMPRRDAVCWTALILGYVQMDKAEEALQLFARMQQEGVVPDARTFVSALKACSSMAESGERNEGEDIAKRERCLDTVRAIHEHVVKGKFELDVFVGNILVDAYAKCRSLEDSRRVFERMPRRDVVSWTAMILGYAQMDKSEEALGLYNRMQQEGVIPNSRTYVSALKACSAMAESSGRINADGTALREKCLKFVKTIHSNILKGKFEFDVFVGNMLVDVYAKCGSLEDARQVFERMPHRDVVSWNAMILGYAQMEKGEEALQLFTRMQMADVVPDNRTYVSALKACSTLAALDDKTGSYQKHVKTCLETVRTIHSNIRKRSSKSDVFVENVLVDAYSKCGGLEDARRVFDNMPLRDVVSWNAMILGYAQMNKGEEALQLYEEMQTEGVLPDERTYVSALMACRTLAASDDMNGNDGTPLNERCLETVRAIHCNLVKEKFAPDVFVGNMLVDVYAKCGSLGDAIRVFDDMPDRTIVSWTAMIMAYVQMDMGEDALHLYARMQQEGMVPNFRTYVGALKACGSVAALEKGKDIHAQILGTSLGPIDSFVAISLIDMYGKCGSMGDAQQVFETLPVRDIVAWTALIAGYAHQGESERVIDLFERMKQEGIHPHGITFLCVLTVCSHVGLVDKGQHYFEAMIRDYGITPTLKHFTSLVDLLARSGKLDKAMEIVKKMPFQPDSAVWECVLGACQKWVDVEIGRQAFESAVRLNADDVAAYILMSNIFVAAGMVDEAKKIQARRTISRAWKQPGWSRWTDVSGIAHVFVVADQGLESQRIYTALKNILMKMKKEGCLPPLALVLPDIPDEEREDVLCGQSQKLAVAKAVIEARERTLALV